MLQLFTQAYKNNVYLWHNTLLVTTLLRNISSPLIKAEEETFKIQLKNNDYSLINIITSIYI
jgi:hypothetical protein